MKEIEKGPADNAAQAGARSGEPARILVVDDNLGVRSLIATTLLERGYKVHLAVNAEEAASLLRHESFDLMLTELALPDGSGLDLVDTAHTQHAQLPVVIVTSIHDISVAIDAMRHGACDYILKPFDKAQLSASALRALAYGQTMHANRSYQQNLEHIVHARTEMLNQAMQDLEHSYDITLEALGDALDLKDAETEGHSKRVTAYTIALARAMEIPPEEIKSIARGAFLHDIGKMAIPDGILRKPGPLTEEEQLIMREHCTLGYNIVRKIPFLSEPAKIVFCHQERFDGSGYPSSLRGAEIPIGARIFAVADTLDAITSDRPYRPAGGFEKARAEILRCSGTQFDPAVVEAFLKIPNELWHELRQAITSQHKRFSTFDVETEPADDSVAAKQ